MSDKRSVVHILSAGDEFGHFGRFGQGVAEADIRMSARFRSEVHRRRYLEHRTFVRAVLAKFTHVNAKELVFIQHRNGRPFVTDNAGHRLSIKFSVSHSADVVFIAVSPDIEVGIDVELMRPHTHFALLK